MAQINMPAKKETRDPVETILKGLTIAAQYYGIKDGLKKADLLAKQEERKSQADEIEIAAKNADILSKGFQPVRDETGKLSFVQSDEAKAKQQTAEKLALEKTQAEINRLNRTTEDGGTAGLAYLIKKLAYEKALQEAAEKKAKEEYEKSPAGRVTKLNPTEKEKVGIIASMLSTKNQLEDLVEQGEKPRLYNSRTTVLGIPVGKAIQDTAIEQLINKATDDIGRWRSGGAIGKEEFASFNAMLPVAADDKTSALQKLKNFEREAQIRLTPYGFKSSELPDAGFPMYLRGDSSKAQDKQELSQSLQNLATIPQARAATPTKDGSEAFGPYGPEIEQNDVVFVWDSKQKRYIRKGSP